MQKQLNNFLGFIENDKKVSQNTLQSYRRDILQYARYIERNKLNYLKKSKMVKKSYKEF